MTFFKNKEHLAVATSLRKDIIAMAHHTAHVAVALSCVDILAALYFDVLKTNPKDPSDDARDRFIMSKGHGCMALYAVMAHAGFFPRELLETYGNPGSLLAEHPLSKLPGLELATGSLGHGLAVAAGRAKGLKLQGKNDQRAFVLLGDGECDEGAVWEAAAAASSQQLDNMVAIVDMNGWQACGKTANISSGVKLADCWKSFGWDVTEIDGHDYPSLVNAFNARSASGKPRVVLCRTVKGKGVDFMENNLEWHYRPVRGADRDAALKALTKGLSDA